MKVSEAVCDHRNIDPVIFNSKIRKPDIAEARMLAYYIHYNLLSSPWSTITIGEQYGGRHHSTILAGLRQIAKRKLQPEAKEIAERYLSAYLSA